jgi:flagellar protein FliO/FliZ
MISPDPESVSLLQIVFACAVVLGLLALLALGLKFIGRRSLPFAGSRRMQVVETLNIDLRRRLVIVRCDGAEHLLLLGGERDLVVETRLETGKTGPLATKDAI